MVLEVFHNASHGVGDDVKESKFHSTGEHFTISSHVKGGVVVAIRGDTGKSELSEWEQNSITLSLSDTDKLIAGLQEAAEYLRKLPALLASKPGVIIDNVDE